MHQPTKHALFRPALTGVALAVAAAGVWLVPALAGDAPWALAVAVGLAAAIVLAPAAALASTRLRAPAQRPASPVPARGTTRRGFLQTGAVGSVAVAGLARVAPAGAQDPIPHRITICEGDRRMVDGTLVFMRGFRLTESSEDRPVIPGPCLGNTGPGVRGRELFEREPVVIELTNDTPRDHVFVITKQGGESSDQHIVKQRVPAGETTTIRFDAPSAGTYIYRDADRNNRILGMAGSMIVQPQDVGGRLLPYAPNPAYQEIKAELRGQWCWHLTDLDPVLGEYARAHRGDYKLEFPLSKIVPRYFMINGQTGDESTLNTALTVPVVPLQEGSAAVSGILIRCINLGIATHSLHWHGNHVFPVERNGVPQTHDHVYERDVQRLEPLSRVSVILPAHTGYDAFPPLNEHHPKHEEQHFPMHCHAEMSQTCAGGGYPFGMLTDWHLTFDEHAAATVRKRLATQRQLGRRIVPEAEVIAAAEQRGGNSGSGKGRGRGRGNGRSGKG